jgi:hypothetical protein
MVQSVSVRIAMEHVLKFVAETKFTYSRSRSSIVLQPNLVRHENEEIRRDWVKSAGALFQTQRQDMQGKIAWLTLATRYLAADRMSEYVFDVGR